MTKSKVSTSYALRSYFSFIGKHKAGYWVVFFTFVVSNTLLAFIPVFIGKTVGILSVKPIDHSALTFAVLGLLLCSMLHDLTWRLSEYVFLKFLLPMSYQFETLAYKEVVRKPYPYFVDKFTGKVASYVNLLGDEFKKFVEESTYTYAGHIVGLVSMVIILWSVNIQTAALFLLGLLGMFVVGRLTIRNNAFYEKKFTDVRSTKNGIIIDSIGNFPSIKSFHKEHREISTVISEQNKTIKAAKKSYFWAVVFWASQSFFIRYFIWASVILLNISLFLDGKINIAQLTTLLSALLIFSNFIWEIIWNTNQFILQLARMEEAHNYLFGPTNITKDHFETIHPKLKVPEFKDSLQIKELTFVYPDHEKKCAT